MEKMDKESIRNDIKYILKQYNIQPNEVDRIATEMTQYINRKMYNAHRIISEQIKNFVDQGMQEIFRQKINPYVEKFTEKEEEIPSTV